MPSSADRPATPWTQERYEGYRRALREAGIEVDEKLIFQAGRLIEDGAKAAAQMLNEACDATAIQAVNDMVAVGCANFLMNQGVRIPQDISVTGFGNTLLSEYFRVPLTTARQPKHRLGTAAVECMIQLLKGQSAGVAALARRYFDPGQQRHRSCYTCTQTFERRTLRRTL